MFTFQTQFSKCKFFAFPNVPIATAGCLCFENSFRLIMVLQRALVEFYNLNWPLTKLLLNVLYRRNFLLSIDLVSTQHIISQGKSLPWNQQVQ